MKQLKVKKIIMPCIVVVFLLSVSGVFAQIPDDVIRGFKNGDAAVLSGYFNQNIEMVVPGHDDVYSKAQAQQIISNFFSGNKVQEFNMIHQGGKEGARYFIGMLKTGNSNTFRVYCLLKNSGNKAFIHQMRIEKQR